MRRITLQALGPSRTRIAGWVLASDGVVLATVAEPARAIDLHILRDAVVSQVLDADFGDTVLAGVAFAEHLGGDAIGFT